MIIRKRTEIEIVVSTSETNLSQTHLLGNGHTNVNITCTRKSQ